MTSARSLFTDGTMLKLALQRKGRLTEHSMSLLHQIGLSFESYGQRLFSPVRNFPLSLLFARDDDIPGYVARNTVDLGIVGHNLVHEFEADVEIVRPLGFGYCELVIAVPNESGISDPAESTTAASPRATRRNPSLLIRLAATRKSSVSSSVITPALQIADAIVDLRRQDRHQARDLRPIHPSRPCSSPIATHWLTNSARTSTGSSPHQR